MLHRSLLFSSDYETSRRMSRALNELEFPVTHCPEIFGAIEKITAHSFAVIVADWDDGVEAIFLLKTARELKCNSSAFRIVLAKPEAAAAAQQAGAHLVITKPILPGHTKYALLTSDVFIGRLQNRPPAIVAGDAAPPVQKLPKPQFEAAPNPLVRTVAPPQKSVSTQNLSPVQPPLAGFLPATPSFATLDTNNFFRRIGIRFDPAAMKSKPQFRPILWGTIVAAILSMGYALSGTLKTEASSMFGGAAPVVATAEARQPAQLITANPPEQSEPKIRIAPTRAATSPEQAKAESMPIAQPQEEPAEPKLEAVASHAPPFHASIPESLTSPLEKEVGSRSASSRTVPSLLSGIEPVSLTEDLSEKMVIQRVLPNYPDQARQAGLQGAVLLQAWIRKDGTVGDIKIIKGPLLLGQAAYQAVKQWRYKPYLLNGQLVEAQTYVTVNFRLP